MCNTSPQVTEAGGWQMGYIKTQKEASEMTQQVEALCHQVRQPKQSQDPHGGGKEPSPARCPLTFPLPMYHRRCIPTCTGVQCVCVRERHTHQVDKYK